jgi:hypothetical protein
MDENGITTIAAGQQFTKEDGKILPMPRAPYDEDFVRLDNLQRASSRPAEGKPLPMP